MSFGVAPSDIWLAIQGCRWLLEHCFDKNNSADERYNRLEKDVELLEGRLQRLMPALEDALQRYENPELDAFDLRCDLKNLVGDFQHTIDQCKEVLTKHVNLQRNRAGVIENVIWASAAHDKVDALRRAIQFHTQKIYMVIEPVNLNILTTIDGKVDEMLDLMRRHFSVPNPLPGLPQWLEMRLSQTVFEKAPQSFISLDQIPLKEGFDALYAHFRESTYAFRDPETADQTPEQYLNLLKCQWLLETLQTSTQFKRARSGSLYPRTMGQIEQRIFKQHERNDIVHFSDPVLKSLNPTAFLIWPPEQLLETKFPTDPNDGEKLILKLSLQSASGNEKDNLVLFRTGLTTLRIARRFIDRSGTPYYENDRFNIHHDKFTPFYAIAESSGSGPQRTAPTSSISIYRGNETGATAYEITGEKDMLNFQRAITGYLVAFDKTADWAIKHSRNLPLGRGRIQIWHWKPLVEDLSTRTSISSPTTSIRSPGSHFSGRSDAVVEKVLSGRNMSRVSVKERSKTESIICASTPPHPVVMIYARENNTYSYFYIELDFGLQIVPASCQCNRNPQSCHRSVIEKRRNGSSELPFLVRRMSAETEQLSDWNLTVFGQPRHPMFHTSKNIQQMEKCKYLNLDFNSVEDKLEFVTKFNKAIKLRDQAENEFQDILRTSEFFGEKMGVPEEGKKLTKVREKRSSSMTTLAEGPPFLEPISRFSSLTINTHPPK